MDTFNIFTVIMLHTQKSQSYVIVVSLLLFTLLIKE